LIDLVGTSKALCDAVASSVHFFVRARALLDRIDDAALGQPVADTNKHR
jgi:hypothetical protein